MRRAPLTLSVLICACLAAAPTAAPKWSYAASDHFEIYTTAGDRRAREALAYFERVHAFFTDFMKMTPDTKRPTRLIVFSGDKEFAPYRPNEVASAYYQPGADRDFIVMKSFDADSYPVVVHEYVHLIIRHSAGDYPIWLNEGLAEFFSTIAADGAHMSVGKVPIGRLQHLYDNQLLPVARLLAIDHNAPEYNTNQHAGTFYSESWALVHMLMTDKRYSPDRARLVKEIVDGKPAPEAFQSVYGKSTKTLQDDLAAYVRKQAYGYFLAPYKEPKIAATLPVRPVDGFEADLVGATLLANGVTHEPQARAAFEALAKQNPTHLEMVESRAYFELWHGHQMEAMPFFARAVELGSTNPQLYFDYAVFGAPDGTRETLLAKAVSLAPEEARFRIHLADMQLRARRAADALATLKPLTHVSPDDAFMLFQVLANAHVMEGHGPEARAAAGLALTHAATPQEREYAAALVARVDRYNAAMQQQEQIRAAAGASAGARSQPAPASPQPAGPAPAETAIPKPATRPLPNDAFNPSVVEVGRIRNLYCGSNSPILEVVTAKGTVRLVIDEPLAIRVLGKDGIQTDLQCGAQDVPAKVGWVPAVDRQRDTIGKVRLLDFTIK